MQIERWLTEHGLERFAEVFEREQIGYQDLGLLTEDDILELKLPLGPRKRLLAALQQLPVLAAQSKETAKRTHSKAQRRQLTVMFCDMVGSTAMSRELDPEDLRDINLHFQEVTKQCIERYDGYVARFMGDGVLAYFGFPLAHEDDAERAVRSALQLVKAIVAENNLQVRIGIATGLVVVGDVIGEGASKEHAVVGETANLAARLQGAAEPNTVVVSTRTHALTRNRFEWQDLGSKRFKGFDVDVPVWQVITGVTTSTRFESGLSSVTPLVGREHETGLLLERWQQVKEGQGQVVLLSGEPGIGKSRLSANLLALININNLAVFRYQCSPYLGNSPLHPVIDQLTHELGLTDKRSAFAKLTAFAEAHPVSEDWVSLIAALLSLPTEPRTALPPMTPDRQKARTLDVLSEHIEQLGQSQPVFLLFEDLHWADPTTLEFIGTLIPRITNRSVLLVATFRPEFEAHWAGESNVTQLSLARLSRDNVNRVVEQVLDGVDLPESVRRDITERADGVPLFVEELTRALMDSHEQSLFSEKSDRIPATLHDLLIARLDGLDAAARYLVQLASAVGREVPHSVLNDLMQPSDFTFAKALESAILSGLIYQSGSVPDCRYIFKHALVRDASYESLLNSTRKKFHHRIATTLTNADTIVPEVLAHHYSAAGEDKLACDYWQKAGESAASKAANLEAIAHFRAALDLLLKGTDTPSRDRRELTLLARLGPALMLMQGWASSEVGQCYERARSLATKLEASADLAPPLVGTWLYEMTNGHLDNADDVTNRLFEVAESTGDEELLLQAHHAAWPVPLIRGRLTESAEQIEHGLAIYNHDKHKHHAMIYLGHDPAVCGHSLGAQVTWKLGDHARAHQHAEQAMQIARKLNHLPTIAIGLWFTATYHAACGNAEATLAAATELHQLSEDQKIRLTIPGALILGGWATAKLNAREEGIERMRTGLALWQRSGAKTWVQAYNCLLAEQLLLAGHLTEADKTLQQALQEGKLIGEHWWESRAYQLRARIQVENGDLPTAYQLLGEGRQIALSQGAKSRELGIVKDLADLLVRQGKQKEASEILQPVCSWFSNVSDDPQVVAARKLLSNIDQSFSNEIPE